MGTPWWQAAHQQNIDNARAGAAMQQQAAARQQAAAQQNNPISPPMPPRYDPPPAANAKRNNRIVVRGMGGGAIGGVGAIGIHAAILLAGHSSAGRDVLIEAAILAAAILGILGAIVGLIVGLTALAVIRILAGKNALSFYREKNAAISLIASGAGIVAGAIILLEGVIGQLYIIAVVLGAGVVAGALVAGIVRKKS
jgi:hypothetical protein